MKSNHKTLYHVVLGVGIIGSLSCIYYKFWFETLPDEGDTSGSSAVEEESPLQEIAYIAPSEGRINEERLQEILAIVLTKNNDLTAQINNQKLAIQSLQEQLDIIKEKLDITREDFEDSKVLSAMQHKVLQKVILALKNVEEDQAVFSVEIMTLQEEFTPEEEKEYQDLMKSEAIDKLKNHFGDEIISRLLLEGKEGRCAESAIESLLDDNSNNSSAIDRNLGPAEEPELPSNSLDAAGVHLEDIDFPA
ncbi:MAG: hypothetical protein P8P83_05345 [Rickettsiaceae bacterium]|nr:hypothetical protein [Rickettsiaceae bacterium]